MGRDNHKSNDNLPNETSQPQGEKNAPARTINYTGISKRSRHLFQRVRGDVRQPVGVNPEDEGLRGLHVLDQTTAPGGRSQARMRRTGGRQVEGRTYVRGVEDTRGGGGVYL